MAGSHYVRCECRARPVGVCRSRRYGIGFCKTRRSCSRIVSDLRHGRALDQVLGPPVDRLIPAHPLPRRLWSDGFNSFRHGRLVPRRRHLSPCPSTCCAPRHSRYRGESCYVAVDFVSRKSRKPSIAPERMHRFSPGDLDSTDRFCEILQAAFRPRSMISYVTKRELGYSSRRARTWLNQKPTCRSNTGGTVICNYVM